MILYRLSAFTQSYLYRMRGQHLLQGPVVHPLQLRQLGILAAYQYSAERSIKKMDGWEIYGRENSYDLGRKELVQREKTTELSFVDHFAMLYTVLLSFGRVKQGNTIIHKQER